MISKRLGREQKIVGLILLVSILFRLFKLSELFQFSLDEEVWAYRIYRVIAYHDLRLIGNEISSTKLFTGPLYVYFHVPFLWLSKLNPIIGGYLWSGVGVLTTLLVYLFTKSKFSKKVGYWASLLYAGSFSMALADRRYWNVTPIPIVSLVGGWLLLGSFAGKRYYLIWLALLVTFGIHSHFSAIVILVGIILTLVWQKEKVKKLIAKKSWYKKELILSGVLVLVLNMGPQLLFDLRHDFWHVRALRQLVTSFSEPKKSESNANFSGIATRFGESMGSLLYLGQKVDVADESSHCAPIIEARTKSPKLIQIMGAMVVVYMIGTSFKKRKEPLSQFLLVLVGLNLLGLLVYREKVFTYHFAPIMPWFFIYLADALTGLKKRVGGVLVGTVVVILITANLGSLWTAESEMGYETKQKIVQTIIEETSGEKIAVEMLDSCDIYGMRYLFTYLGKGASRSWEDGILGHLFPEELSDEVDTLVTVAVSDEGAGESFWSDYMRLKSTADKEIKVGKATMFFERQN